MSRSLDMQVIFQRTPDISKIQQSKLNQGQNQNHHNAVITKQQFAEKEKSVNKMDYIDKKNIKDERNNRNSNFTKEENNKENKKDNEKEKVDSITQKLLGNSIDLHV